nr:creatininase family protein [Acetobacter garciniae]
MALCAAHGARAQSSCPAEQSVVFERLSWTEIQQDIGCGFTTIIIPVGGTEQSGPYIAVGKHNVRAGALAERIAQKAGRTLVAPVVAYVPEGSTSPRTSHMRFAGTISIPTDVFEKMLSSAAESFRVQGFRLVVLLGDHGGYQAALRKVADTLNPAWRKTGARVLYVPEYYEVVPHQYADWLRQKGYGADVGKHADLSDTSLMLAVDPGMVREQALRQAPPPTPAQGIYGGDPRPATPALGRPGLDMQVRAALTAIEQARAP